ncbi:MAG: ABC transporter permease, partial [Gammaproteobacteria bacterium]|nr:ABC transporter permease [Gammaproteobacteria bacterium]
MLIRLAWRNLWRHTRRTLITLSSIALGFGLAVLSIGFGDSSHNSMIRNAIQYGEGHITLQPEGYLDAPANHHYIADSRPLSALLSSLPIRGEIEPRISLQVLATTANHAVGAALEGAIMAQDSKAEQLRPRLIAGEWIAPDDPLGLLIGKELARSLKVGVGSKIVLMAGTTEGETQAHLGRVRGIFDAPIEALDRYLLLSSLHFARRFLQGEGADPAHQPLTRYAIFLEDERQTAYWKPIIQQQLPHQTAATPPIVVLDWQEMMPQLVQFILLDDAGNYLFLSLIMVLVVFGIVNTVLMSVLERTREFGLLRALGLGRSELLLLVFYESLLLGTVAVCAGWVVGGGLHLWFSHYGIDLSSLGISIELVGTVMDSTLYTELSWQRIIQLTLIVFGATLFS